MNVSLLDLKPQLSGMREDIMRALTGVIDSTRYVLGPEVTQFEEAVAAYCGTTHAIGLSSGTDALLVSLMALDIGHGDLVMTTPYTFFATMGCILRVGAMPIFVDIKPESMNIDPEKMADILEQDRRKGQRIKAVIPVHLFGQCADMQPIVTLTEEYGIPVIEDAAQAIGADCPFFDVDEQVSWKRAGSMGATGCFSFFPSKNLGGIGDGGMVTTSDGKLAERIRRLRNHGAHPKYVHAMVGGNFRLDPVQACVLNVKLPHLEEWHQARRRNSNLYGRLFADKGLRDRPVVLPPALFKDVKGAESRNYHIYNQYVIRVPERDQLRDFLVENNIGCEIYYPLCLHQQECVSAYGYANMSFPRAEQAAGETLALPIYPELSSEQQNYVVEKISEFFQVG